VRGIRGGEELLRRFRHTHQRSTPVNRTTDLRQRPYLRMHVCAC
jgi:hypothetical protein